MSKQNRRKKRSKPGQRRSKSHSQSHSQKTSSFFFPVNSPGFSTEEISQRERIEKLKQQAAELAGGEMTFWENEAMPLDVQEQFWQNVLSFETGAGDAASSYVPVEVLKDDGVEFPPADELDDEALTRKLWEVIHAMARQRWYLFHTDHLSDRELYVKLVEDLLAEETVRAFPEAGLVIDAMGSYGPEEIAIVLTYYSDEKARRDWTKSFPEDEIPEAEDPPYDRDRRLPYLTDDGWSPPSGEEAELVM